VPDRDRVVGRVLVANHHGPKPLMPDDRRRRVLLVEDNPVNQAVGVAILAKLGYGVEVVGNGREAVEAVVLSDYGAVLMDCQLPVLDGYQATAEIRRREGNERHTPIIAMTAAALPENRERCLAAGMDDYIAKPVLVGNVQWVLSRWLGGEARAQTSASADPVEPAGGVLDPDRLAALGQLDSAGNGSALLGRLVDCFLTSASADLAGLHAAVQRGDRTAMTDLVHRLKGAAASLGSTGLVDLCQELEALGSADVLTPVGDLLGRLEEEFGRVTSALDALKAMR
jgi:two-component system, sensor histidine kinase and response regulator